MRERDSVTCFERLGRARWRAADARSWARSREPGAACGSGGFFVKTDGVIIMFCFAQPRTHDNVRIPKRLLSELRLFQTNPDLVAAGRYAITSAVDPEVVDLFFGRVGGDTEKVVTQENAEQLRALCDELGFSGFDDELRAVLGSDWKVRKEF